MEIKTYLFFFSKPTYIVENARGNGVIETGYVSYAYVGVLLWMCVDEFPERSSQRLL